ncbi:hypothetical protein GEV33_002117 [Tenebrio molitor]|uniref:protein-tyrosine-phosphatase n=1 Tax=Tenebrio molitor TaxID=7067 RepID=A0A8J6LF35_TENMO|nr:hypothetical protein GEV33_002117 [Tenebrio molitor]
MKSTNRKDYEQKTETYSKPVKISKYPDYVKNSLKNGELEILNTVKIYETIIDDITIDYLDTEYIDGQQVTKSHLAAKVPESDKFPLFWKLIWKENIKYIILLDNRFEDDQETAKNYWHVKDEDLRHHRLSLTFKSCDIFSDYECRKFILTFKKTSRHIVLYRYCSWWNTSTPLSSLPLIPFFQTTSKVPLNSKSPILFQCSTAVEGTGFALLCDISLRTANRDGTVDIFRTSHRLAKCDPNLINNINYYLLAHFVIFENCFKIDTKLKCDPFRGGTFIPLSEQQIRKYFKYVQETQWLDTIKYETGNKSVRKEQSLIAPYSLDYDDVSACFGVVTIDGFRCPGKFTTIKEPTPDALFQFWNFVANKNISVKIIEIIVMKNWSSEATRPENVPDFVKFCNETNTILKKSISVLVMSHNGIKDSGLYIAMLYNIKTMEVEGVCDVPTSVRMVRNHSPEFRITEGDFTFLFEATENYLKEAQLYEYDNSDSPYLTNKEWRHFQLSKKDNRLSFRRLNNKDAIIQYDDREEVYKITHMMIHSKDTITGVWKIHRDCDSGFYGMNCKKRCGHCSKHSCDFVNGKCDRCSDNYVGAKCDIPPGQVFSEPPVVSDIKYSEAKVKVKNFELANKEYKDAPDIYYVEYRKAEENSEWMASDQRNPFSTSAIIKLQHLEPNTDYIVRSVITTINNKTFIDENLPHAVFTTKCYVHTLGEPVDVPQDLSLLALLSLLLIIPIAIILFIKRGPLIENYNSLKTSMCQRTCLETSTPDEQTPLKNIAPENTKLYSKKVKIAELEQYVTESLNNGELERQHALFPRGQTKPWERGALKENKSKNRYTNLMAYDHTRVVLQWINGNKNSDYINANYIDGYNVRKAYIATQGPKISTVHDFWRMIWQENVLHVAMLANIYEGKKKKVEKYWPDQNENLSFGDITVYHMSGQVFADYEQRTFKVCFNNQTRKLQQYHFSSWPDHGVPLYSQSLVPFLQKIQQIPLDSKSPVVVHCSAGVGRTGTILLCDICLRMAAKEDAVDMLRTLQQLRDQRANMVDNIQQYKLAHLVILECLVGKQTGIPCSEIETEVKKLLSGDRITQQMRYLKDTAWQDKTMKSVASNDAFVVVQEKNRFQNIVPEIQGCMFLSRYPIHDDTSTYINAVRVDGFRCPGRFIVTQQPMPNTLGDFWRLVHEKETTVIVSLNPVNPKNKTSCLFWPTEKQPELTPVDYITLKHATTLSLDSYNLTTIRMHINASEEYTVVQIISMKDWAAKKNCPKKIEDFLTFCEESYVISRQSSSVVVTCFDGVLASGVYVAMSFVIEKMKLEQICDVCQAVRTVRHNRNEFVQNEEQFAFLLYFAILLIHLEKSTAQKDFFITHKHGTTYNCVTNSSFALSWIKEDIEEDADSAYIPRPDLNSFNCNITDDNRTRHYFVKTPWELKKPQDSDINEIILDERWEGSI